MMGEIFKLFGTIGLNNQEANKGIDETTGKAESAGTKIAGFFKSRRCDWCGVRGSKTC